MADQHPFGYEERFKFTGKERDSETSYDYFGARFYASLFGFWLSVDPLSDKYPNISPYAYCNWNPIKYVDPEGRKAELSIKQNTIIVSANYYAKKSDIPYAIKAIRFWNDLKGLTYTDKSGHTYSVQFNLKVFISSGIPNNDAVHSSDNCSNSFEIVPFIRSTEEGNIVTGETISNYRILVMDSHKDGLTGAHEVGHTLMNISAQFDNEHSKSGVMTKYGNVSSREACVTQETINKIVESNGFYKLNKSSWQKFISWFGDYFFP